MIVALTLDADASYLALAPGLVILGLGQGAGYTLMFGAASTNIPAHEQGIASGMASTTQQIGGAVGLAVLVALANAGTHGLRGDALRTATTAGLRATILVATAGIAATTLTALGFTRTPRSGPTPADLATAKTT